MTKNDLKTAWIEEIPDDWRMVRASLAVTPVERPPLPEDEVVTCFRDGEVTLRSNRRTDGFTVSFQEIGYQHIEEGDLVIHSMDGGWGAIGVSDSDGKASPVVHAYRSEENDVKFVAYVLRAMAYSGYLIAQTKGIRERSTQFDRKSFSNLYLPLPDLETQRRIADYLDKEISEMDALIEEFERLVADLNARKDPVTVNVIARELGVDENFEGTFPVTDISSSSEWANAGYEFTVPLSAVLRFRNEPNTNQDAQYLSLTNDRGVIRYEDKGNVGNKKPEDLTRTKVVKAGDMLVNSMNFWIGSYGISPYDGVVSTVYHIMDTDESVLDRRYLNHWFNVREFRNQAQNLGNGILMHRRSIPERRFASVRIPVPPLDKQREIAGELDRETAKMDALIEESTRLIENLNARKTALITEVVTGRKEV